MRTCKACGVPVIVGRDQEWNPDGTITISGDPDFRMALFELDVLRGIISKLEAMIGPTVHNMLQEGSRKYARHYTNSLLKGPLRLLVRHTRSGAKKAYTKLLDTALALGFGKIELQEYEHHQRVAGVVHNPYILHWFIGIVRGSFEAIEGVPSLARWEEKGDIAKVEVNRRIGDFALEDRFIYEDEPRLPGDLEYEHCGKCGLPLAVGRFKWHPDQGTITDERTDARIVMTGIRDLNAVFTELEAAIGDVVPKAVFETNQEFGVRQVKNGWITDYSDLVKDMGVKGIAYISVSEEGGKRSFIIKNPYNKDFVAGRCAGVYTAIEGRSCEPKIEDGPDGITVTME